MQILVTGSCIAFSIPSSISSTSFLAYVPPESFLHKKYRAIAKAIGGNDKINVPSKTMIHDMS